MLEQMIHGRAPAPDEWRVMIQPKLIVREST